MEVTFLTQDQVFGDDKLDVLRAYGTKTGATDLTVALGGSEIPVDEPFNNLVVKQSKTSEGDISCSFWTSSSERPLVDLPFLGYNICCVSPFEDNDIAFPTDCHIAARPALSASETSKIQPSNERTIQLPNGRSVKVCEYGEYPQQVVEAATAKRLNALQKDSALHKTGKKYVFNNPNRIFSFSPKGYHEYALDGKKYVCVNVENDQRFKHSAFANGQQLKPGEAYWFEVQPIEWLMDKSGIWVSKKALFSGIPFHGSKVFDKDFSKMDIKDYLDKHFCDQIMPSRDYEHKQSIVDQMRNLIKKGHSQQPSEKQDENLLAASSQPKQPEYKCDPEQLKRMHEQKKNQRA